MLPVMTGSISACRIERGLLAPLQRPEPVLGCHEDEIDLSLYQLLSGRLDVVGHVDQVDTLAERLVQRFGIDTHCFSALLGHQHRPKRLWRLLIAETEQEEDQEWPQDQSRDQSGLSPHRHQLLANEREASGQGSHGVDSARQGNLVF